MKSNTISIKSIMNKHTVLLVRKCLDGKACNTFNEYFEFNHSKSTRNNYVLLKVHKVKLDMSTAVLGVKYYSLLLLVIQKPNHDFRDKVTSYFKNIESRYSISC